MQVTAYTTELNYSFVFSRIIAFFSLYFSIYAFPYLGELAFLPIYLCLLIYTGIFLLISFVIVAVFFLGNRLKAPVGDELKDIEKRSGGWKGFLYNGFDIAMFWFMGFVWTRNGFPDMAGWMNVFIITAILMTFQALYLRYWMKGGKF